MTINIRTMRNHLLLLLLSMAAVSGDTRGTSPQAHRNLPHLKRGHIKKGHHADTQRQAGDGPTGPVLGPGMTAMTRGVPGAKGSHKYSDDEYAAGHKTAKKGKGEYAEDTYPPVYPPGYPDDEFVPGVPGKGSKKAPCEYYTDETYTTSSGSKKGSHKYPDYEYVPGPGGKGKGAFSKKSKKGKGGCSSSEKGSKKGGVDNPAPAPHPYPPAYHPSRDSIDAPSARPPIDMGPTSPTTPPVQGPSPVPQPPSLFTPSPTSLRSVKIDLDPFRLLFEVSEGRQPMRTELVELTDLTRSYLEEFMFQEFSQTSFTILDDFITKMMTSTYSMGAPIIVDFTASARFNPFTSVFPQETMLNEALEMSFSGENLVEYQSRLNNISPGNLFRGAQVFFSEPVTRVVKRNSGKSGVGIAAGAVAFTLLAAGLVLYKRRMDTEEDAGKDMNKAPAGDITVAGETYAGETCDGSASVDAASLEAYRYRDEEEGGKPLTLGTIPETFDDASHTAAFWGASPMYDDDEEQGCEDDEAESVEFVRSFIESSDRVIRTLGTVGSTVSDGSMSTRSQTDCDTDAGKIAEMQSFEEIALQEPSCQTGPLLGYEQGGTRRSPIVEESDGASQISESEVSQFVESTSHQQPRPATTNEIASLLSFDSAEGDWNSADSQIQSKAHDNDNGSVSRRPRTVAEIEALLSSNLDDDLVDTPDIIDDIPEAEESINPTNRPRTVSEIESLLSADFDDDASYSPSLSSRSLASSKSN